MQMKIRTEEEIKEQIKFVKKVQKKYAHLPDLKMIFQTQVQVLEWVIGKRKEI